MPLAESRNPGGTCAASQPGVSSSACGDCRTQRSLRRSSAGSKAESGMSSSKRNCVKRSRSITRPEPSDRSLRTGMCAGAASPSAGGAFISRKMYQVPAAKTAK